MCKMVGLQEHGWEATRTFWKPLGAVWKGVSWTKTQILSCELQHDARALRTASIDPPSPPPPSPNPGLGYWSMRHSSAPITLSVQNWVFHSPHALICACVSFFGFPIDCSFGKSWEEPSLERGSSNLYFHWESFFLKILSNTVAGIICDQNIFPPKIREYPHWAHNHIL